MKIRKGYVSNSSSSSFFVVGVQYEQSKFDKDYDDLDLEGTDLEYQNGISDYCGEYIIGIPILKMKDEQTLAQFKESIFEQLKKIGFIGNKEDIQILIDGGYDG